MYTFIVQHSKTVLCDDDSISVIHGKLQSHDGAVVKENCFAYVKNDTKPRVFKCWQDKPVFDPEFPKARFTQPVDIPIGEIDDITGLDSSCVDLSYNSRTGKIKDWSMTPDRQPYFDDDD